MLISELRKQYNVFFINNYISDIFYIYIYRYVIYLQYFSLARVYTFRKDIINIIYLL